MAEACRPTAVIKALLPVSCWQALTAADTMTKSKGELLTGLDPCVPLVQAVMPCQHHLLGTAGKRYASARCASKVHSLGKA